MPRRRKPLPRRGKRTARQIHYSKVRGDVEARANGRCELGTPACVTCGSECHHLLQRSQGGADDMGNCVWTCAPCHRYAHDHPTESYAAGWLRHREAS